jgi:hypothetical protein
MQPCRPDERRSSTLVRRGRTTATRAVTLGIGLVAFAGPALAHGGPLGGVARRSPTAPTWLVVAGGAAVVGVSVLLSRSVTRRFATAGGVSDLGLSRSALSALRSVAGLVGIAVLVGVLLSGFAGPTDPLSSPAVAVVWVGWWAGYVMSTYLVGNTWPAVNPWRAIARLPGDVGRTHRWRWGAWPSVAGLVALVWFAVAGPLVDRPRVLAVVVLAYTVVTVAGAVVYGTDTWFRRVDPVARVFRLFGLVAPLGTDRDVGSGTVVVRWPGSALTGDVLAGRDEAAFVVAVLWVTTFDGLVATPFWDGFTRAAARGGVPSLAVSLAVAIVGFGLFWGAYLLSVRLAGRVGPADLEVATLTRRFAPPFLAVAVGYHFAHFFDYFLSLLPTLALAVTEPASTVDPVVFVLPDWAGVVAVAAVLVGHAVAVLAARDVAVELAPESARTRSQSPVLAAIAAYSLVCLWVVT